jgi:xanthine dehydrogenase accessory factor
VKLVERLAQLNESGERGVLFTVVEGDGVGSKLLVLESGERIGEAPEDASAQFDELIRRGRNRVLTLDDGTKVFAEWYGPPPRLFVYGAVDTAEALCRAAKLLGWKAIVADARAKFATAERIPSADELIVAWPDDALAQVQPDHQTAIVVLTHDDKFDEPALQGALETEAFYIGALGSRRNQERRRERLLEAGVPEEALERIMGPSGLDIGADTQEETALSILGEILAVRAQRSGGFLKQATQRIHVEVE